MVENVPAFLSRLVKDPATGEPVSAAALLIRLLESHYRAFPFVTDLADYGVPQRRVRAFLTFLRLDEPSVELLEQTGAAPYPCPVTRPDASTPKSLGEALAELDAMALDAVSSAQARDESNPMHAVPVWGDNRQYRMVAAIEPGSGGRAWQNSQCERVRRG